MTPDKLKALRAVRDGGNVQRHALESLRRQKLIDTQNRLTSEGAQTLADYEEENTGD